MTTTFAATTFVPVAFISEGKNVWRKHPTILKTHLQNEPSKEPARDSEKIGDSEAEDETGKLTVSKSMKGKITSELDINL